MGLKSTDTKILGINWNENEDTLLIEIPKSKGKYTKPNILSHLASVYVPLVFISLAHLLGKIVCCESCELKVPWDQEIPTQLVKKWNKWLTSSPYKTIIPTSIPLLDANISHGDIHVFGNSSIMVTCAVVYAVVFQPNGTQQNIIASKSRLAKQKLSITSLELVATHKAAILADNIKTTLANVNMGNAFGWTDSTVVLHWLKKNGNYSQFVNNRVDKIKEKDYITWRHVPTNEKPADIGCRTVYGNQITSLWWNGPTWLQNRDQWPLQPIIKANEGTEKEAKKIKTVLAANIKLFEADKFDTLLEKYNLWKFLRITPWVSRFINKVRRTKVKGPLLQKNLSINKSSGPKESNNVTRMTTSSNQIQNI